MNIYTSDGWVDLRGPFKDPRFFTYICIASRQVGKTYSAANYVLNELDGGFLWMRRTDTEVQTMMTRPDANPFIEIHSDITIEKSDAKALFDINDISEDPPKWRGYLGALSRLYTVRGFKLSDYIDFMVYDEFIPEKHVRRMAGEGDALLNIYTTLNGNRELHGQPPLKMALLANANNLNSDVLFKLGVTDKIKKMSDKGQELFMDPDRGLVIMLPKAPEVIKRRKRSALARLIGEDSEFYQMAYENKFAYNSDLYVLAVDPRSVRPYLVIGDVFIYVKKDNTGFYVSLKKRGEFPAGTEYPGGAEGVSASIFLNYPVQKAFNLGGVAFESYAAKKKFLDLFRIKV